MEAPPKPNFGEACNGCGVCCIAVPCSLARDFVGAFEGPCPALEHEDGRYWCGLVRNPHKHMIGIKDKPWGDEVIRDILMASGAFGIGCDSVLRGEAMEF